MKAFFFALFVATAAAIPLPDDSGPIDVVVNGVPQGAPLEIGHLLDVNVQEKVNGEIVSSANVLHPYSAQGLAEAAAVAEEAVQPESPAPVQPEVVSPIELPEPAKPEVVPSEEVPPSDLVVEGEILAPVELPAPAQPEVVPSPVELPSPAQPEVVPSPVELPSPAQPEVVPSPVELPSPTLPEVVPEVVQPIETPEPVESLPAPAHQGSIYNDGLVEVHSNVADSSLMNTISGWFNMVINYVTGSGATHTAQIV